MILLTGDKHGDFRKIFEFFESGIINTNKDEDFMIILGDVGLNYYLDKKENELKEKLSKLPITFICVHGNHEERPSKISSYELKHYSKKDIDIIRSLSTKYNNKKNSQINYEIKNNIIGDFYIEPSYPNLLFPVLPSTFKLDNYTFVHLGGAYSPDKFKRLKANAAGNKQFKWFESEQMSKVEQKYTLQLVTFLAEFSKSKPIILSHTCPLRYVPFDSFNGNFNQNGIDKTTEIFLDKIYDIDSTLDWYCGHYHIDKKIDNIRFLYNDIIEI